MPSTSRHSPVAGAAPTSPMSSPSAQERRPLTKLEPDSTPTMARPSTVSMKSSADEKARMTGRAIRMKALSTSAPKMPPTIELKKAAERARAASPRLAIGNPSRIVAWEAALPGMPISTEVKVSPVGTTASRPISSASAEIVSMP